MEGLPFAVGLWIDDVGDQNSRSCPSPMRSSSPFEYMDCMGRRSRPFPATLFRRNRRLIQIVREGGCKDSDDLTITRHHVYSPELWESQILSAIVDTLGFLIISKIRAWKLASSSRSGGKRSSYSSALWSLPSFKNRSLNIINVSVSGATALAVRCRRRDW